jgi:ketosteroid isomerase-like protein
MTQSNHQLVRDFLAALPSGNIPDDLLAPDISVWTTSGGAGVDKARYLGALKLLASITNGPMTYILDSLTAEEDRVVAEVREHGTLINGEDIRNDFLIMFRIRDGRIASIAEHFNPIPVKEKIEPLMRNAMSKTAS